MAAEVVAPPPPPAPAAALDGVRVLDLTHYVAGPFCTKLLAAYGADVIKVERPGTGDGARRMGPFPSDEPHPERSGLFLYLNTGKRGVTLDLSHSEGKGLALDLAERADIVVENFKPGVMEKLGLDYDSLAERNPGVVMLSISNFGQTGPYRDFLANELIEYGMGGQLQSTGTPDRPPVKLGGSIGLYQTGQMAAFAACTALFRKEFTGDGDYVDISIFETQAASQDRRSIFMLNHQYTGALVKRRADAEDLAFGIFPCADGAICFWSGVTRFPRAAELVGRADLLDDPLYAQYEHGGSAESIHHFNNEILLPWLLDRTMDEAWRESQAAGLATAPIFSPGRFFEHPYYRERGFWETISHPAAGDLEYPGAPFRMEATPAKRGRPAPLLGEHNTEVFCGELGRTEAELGALAAVGIV